MRSAAVLLLWAVGTVHADFSYTMTQKAAPGQTADLVVKHFLKGQKSKDDHGNRVVILDFEAQTMTTLDNAAKTYTVTRFADLPTVKGAIEGAEVNVDIQSTGQKKSIAGFTASQVLVTMDLDMPQTRQAGLKPSLEVELWIARDVPGSQELAAFYKKNAANYPLAALGSNSNPSMQKAMAKFQKQLAELDGVPVMEVIRLKAGGSGGPTAEQLQQMAQARAQLEMLSKQGGPQAQAAQAALARMGAAGGGSLFETTMTAGDFSTAPIPDSVFAIPAGYTQAK